MKKIFWACALMIITTASFSQGSTGYVLSADNNSIETKKVVDLLFDGSKTLKDVESIIKSSFEVMGDETLSDNGQLISISYYNGGTMMNLLTYTKIGAIDQVSFVMDESEAWGLYKALAIKHGGVGTDAFLLFVTANLSFEYRKNGDVGIVVIKNKAFR